MASDREEPGFVVLANPGAGGGDGRVLDEAVAILAARAPVEVRRLALPGDLDRALDELAGRTPVAAGGDGTIHQVVGALHRRGLLDRPVGVLPMGTANDLARALDLPLDPVDAAQRVAAGRARDLTLVEVFPGEGASGDGDRPAGVVLNAAHLGVGAAAAEWASSRKERFGRFAYPLGAAATGLRHPGLPAMRMVLDGEPRSEERVLALLVMVGPGAGGGVELVPDREPDDPGFDVVVVPVPDRGWVRFALAADTLRGRLPERKEVERRRVARLEVECDEPLAANADGDLECWGRSWRLEARRAGWRILC